MELLVFFQPKIPELIADSAFFFIPGFFFIDVLP